MASIRLYNLDHLYFLLISSKEACHIGDEPYADVQGANNAGIDAILIDRKGKYGTESITIVRSFLELL